MSPAPGGASWPRLCHRRLGVISVSWLCQGLDVSCALLGTPAHQGCKYFRKCPGLFDRQETGTRVTCVLRITITGWRHLAAAPDFRDVMRVMMRLSRPWSLSLVFPRGLWFTTDHMTGNSWLRIPPGPDGAVEQARSSGSWLGPGQGSIMHTLCYAHMPPAPRSDWRTQCDTGLWLVQPGWSCTDEPISPQILEAYDLIEAARGGGWPCVQCRPGSDHCSPPWPPAMGNLATSGIRQYWDRDQYWLDTPHCQSLSLSLMAPRPARANVSMNWSARHNK